MKHFIKKVGLGLFCLGLGTGSLVEAAEKGLKEKTPPGDAQSKRRLEGEAPDSPRLMLPLDVFDEPAGRQDYSTLRAGYCPSDEGYVWGQLQGASGVDENYAVAAACDRVFLAGNAQGQLGASGGQGGTDIVVRSISADGQANWVRHFGTNANDYAVAIAAGPAVDCTSTRLYVAGYTTGALTSPPRLGSDADAFLIGYNAITNTELWRVQFGGTSNDYIYGMTTDAEGNIYVVGATGSNLGGRTPPSGTTDMFIAKYHTNGTRAWIHQAGVNGKFTAARGVSVGANGSVYVVGYTAAGLNGTTYKGGSYDLFIARYDADGTTPMTTVLLGTTGSELGYGIVATSEGGNTFVYVTGQTDSSFAGNTNQGQFDVITAKFNDTLGTRVWLKQEGGPKNDYAYSIAYSERREEVVVGGSSETDFLTNAALGSSDMLMLTYTTGGNRLFSDHLGGPAREVARAIATDTREGIYLAGSSDGRLCGTTPDGEFTGGVLDSMVVNFDNGCRLNVNDPRCHPGGGTGDPHYFTFDHLFYDFQGGGNFILTRHETDPAFELQARQCSLGSVAIFTGVGARVGSDLVELSSNGTVWLNGTVNTLSAPIRLANGGRIYKAGGPKYVIAWPTGERLLAYAYGGSLDLFVSAPKWRLGHYRGLLGNGDGSRDNEYMERDGTPMQSILSFNEMYRGPDSLASRWRVDTTLDTALITHGVDCTDLDAPHQYVSISTLTPAQQAAGAAACAGVTDPILQEDCILDVGVSGNTAFANNVANLTERLDKGAGAGDPITKIRGVYFNNFTGDIGPEWDSIASNVTPMGGRLFLGEFGNQNVGLTLNNLGTHTKLKVSFDLFIINAWTGDDGFFGSPTVWKAAADGTELLNATFSNWDGTFQSYPAPFMPAQSGAVESDSLGYPYRDSVYRITLEFDHTAPNLTLNLSADGLSGILGESWGVTNFEVQGR